MNPRIAMPAAVLVAIGVVAFGPAVTMTPARAATSARAVTIGARAASGATLSWGMNTVTQGDAFSGGCQYFSTGHSDGSASTYASTSATVNVYDGSGIQPNYGTKCDFTAGLGQYVVFSGGTGTVDTATGVSRISWTGAWSVNFYGGLAPFYIEDPALSVDANGTGTLIATVGGYASSRSDPTSKTPVPAEKNVVIADLSGIKGASASGFTATPAYAGVTYDAPSGDTAQDRSVDGWGAWPTSFDDFQQKTGLSSYWYSSGTSSDDKKAPTPLSIGYGTLGAAATGPSAAASAKSSTAPTAVGSASSAAPSATRSGSSRAPRRHPVIVTPREAGASTGAAPESSGLAIASASASPTETPSGKLAVAALAATGGSVVAPPPGLAAEAAPPAVDLMPTSRRRPAGHDSALVIGGTVGGLLVLVVVGLGLSVRFGWISTLGMRK